jgi:hypothetical protein
MKKSELFLLEWLEFGMAQYGECSGKDLDALVEQGLVQIHDPGEHQSGFIAKGTDMDYRAVSLTESGREALKAIRNEGVI